MMSAFKKAMLAVLLGVSGFSVYGCASTATGTYMGDSGIERPEAFTGSSSNATDSPSTIRQDAATWPGKPGRAVQ